MSDANEDTRMRDKYEGTRRITHVGHTQMRDAEGAGVEGDGQRRGDGGDLAQERRV